MTKDEALDLALEALSPWMDTDADHTEQHAAYYAIKQALAAPVQEPVAKYIGECSDGSLVQLYEDVKKGTDFYTTPPAQPAPVQEPVAYEYHEYRPYGAPGEIRINAILKSRYAMPDGSTAGDYQWLIDQYRANKNTIKLIPLYTTPPAAQRQWVGLSQDELDAMFSNTIKGKKLVNYVARAIEAKLKEKNT